MIFYQLKKEVQCNVFPVVYLPKNLKKAVRLVKSENLTLSEAGRKLDVALKSLKTWIALQQQGALTGILSVA